MNALALIAWMAVAGPAAPEAPQLAFADRLAHRGDWYRAITEYRRFAHHHPSHPLAERALLRVGDLYGAAGKYDAAAAAYEGLAAVAPSPATAVEASWRAARAYERAGRLRRASAHYHRFVTRWPEGERADAARYRGAWTLAQAGDWEAAGQRLAEDPPGGRYKDPAAALAADLAGPSPDEKSPLLAGILSGVLPGAGQAYAGRWGDGLLALLVNGTFIFGTYQAWDNDNTATAVVMGMFGAGFYLGGVFGGVNAAHRFNDQAITDHEAARRSRFSAPFGEAPRPSVDLPVLKGAW